MLQKFHESNRNLIVNINGQLVHRDQAGISPFDSVVQGGDAVWEGLRLYSGRIFRLTEHLDRLRSSALALAFAQIPTHEEIIEQIRRTLAANQMTDGVHIRLTLTRGVKITSGMDPRLNQSGPTLIVLAEHKPPVYDKAGLSAHHQQRPPVSARLPRPQNPPQQPAAIDPGQDRGQRRRRGRRPDARHPRLRGRNQRHARVPGRRRPRPHPPHRRLPRRNHPRHGPDRSATKTELLCDERDLSLTEFYRADEVFCTGTMGELAAVTKIDGRTIGAGTRGPMTERLSGLFGELTKREGVWVVG